MKRNTNKTYTATKEINGTKYIAQFNGVREAVRATELYGKDEVKLAEYILENVIVDPPHLNMDDFEDLQEYRSVTNFAIGVMSGRFRGEKNQGTDKGISEKELASVETGAE